MTTRFSTQLFLTLVAATPALACASADPDPKPAGPDVGGAAGSGGDAGSGGVGVAGAAGSWQQGGAAGFGTGGASGSAGEGGASGAAGAAGSPGSGGGGGVPTSSKPCHNPQWPYITEGHCVEWVGRLWNTRKPSKLATSGGSGVMEERNATATFLGEDKANRGRVTTVVRPDKDILEVGGGGKHFVEVMSWVADRSAKGSLPTPWTRVEIARVADHPKVIVWNYSPNFNGKAAKIFDAGDPWQAGKTYTVTFDWDYIPSSGKLDIEVEINGKSYQEVVDLIPGSEGPGRFFLFGHVETQSGGGHLTVDKVTEG